VAQANLQLFLWLLRLSMPVWSKKSIWANFKTRAAVLAATAANWPNPSAPTAGHANTYNKNEAPYTFL